MLLEQIFNYQLTQLPQNMLQGGKRNITHVHMHMSFDISSQVSKFRSDPLILKSQKQKQTKKEALFGWLASFY